MKLTVRQNKNREPIEINRFAVVRREGFEPPGLLVRRLSQGQIGAVSAPICDFCHRSLGGFSVVSVQPCLLFSDSGSKLGQEQGDSNFAGLALKFFLRDEMAHGIIKVQSQEKL